MTQPETCSVVLYLKHRRCGLKLASANDPPRIGTYSPPLPYSASGSLHPPDQVNGRSGSIPAAGRAPTDDR